MADAFEHGVGAEAAGELAHALDRLVAALADDVGRAELPRERDPVGVAAEQDDLLGAEALRGDHAAEADRAVADDRRGLAGADPGAATAAWWPVAHHVGERQQRRHQRVVRADRQDDERAVRLRDAHRLALAAVELGPAPAAAVEARGVQPLPAEDAGAVGPGERRDDEVAGLDGADLGADVLDDADELVAHAAAGLARLHRLVGPEVAAADAGAGDAHEGVGRFDDPGVGDVLDADVAGAVHDGCSHRRSPSQRSIIRCDASA